MFVSDLETSSSSCRDVPDGDMKDSSCICLYNDGIAVHLLRTRTTPLLTITVGGLNGPHYFTSAISTRAKDHLMLCSRIGVPGTERCRELPTAPQYRSSALDSVVTWILPVSPCNPNDLGSGPLLAYSPLADGSAW